MKKISDTRKLQALHILNHLAIIPAIWFIATNMQLGFVFLALSFLWWNVLASVGISFSYHRHLSHKTTNCPLWFEKLAVVLGCLTTSGSPISWVGVHRMHHADSEGDSDPHSPLRGFLTSYMHNWKVKRIPRKYIKDLLQKDYLLFLHRNYFKILLAYIAILYLINPWLGIFMYSIPAVFAFHGFGGINYLSHKFGYRNFDVNDDSRNNWFANILTAGEGWHNNHHYLPSSHRIGNIQRNKWWEFDITAWWIELFKFNKRSI